MHFLYIIYSKKADRYYIGETSNLENRLQDHVLHKYKKGFTKSAEDWETVLMESFDHKEDALFLEKFIKRMKSRKFIQKLIAHPDILQELLKTK